MTTSQTLNRRLLRVALVWIAVVLVLYVGESSNALRLSPRISLAKLVACLIGVAVALWYLWRTPCAHCQKALGWVAWSRSANAGDTPCPNCGVSIDRDARH